MSSCCAQRATRLCFRAGALRARAFVLSCIRAVVAASTASPGECIKTWANRGAFVGQLRIVGGILGCRIRTICLPGPQAPIGLAKTNTLQ